MIKTKTKIILTISLALLFLITSIGQARAAAGQAKAQTVYRVNYDSIAKGLQYYLWEPTVDLAVFTGQNLVRTFKSFPPAVNVTKSYFQGVNYLGRIAKNTLGSLFNNTGFLLAGVGQHLPNFKEISIGYGNLLINSGKRINETVAFFQETFSDLTDTPKKQNYPHTQSLIANARRNLENNFNRIIRATTAEANQMK